MNTDYAVALVQFADDLDRALSRASSNGLSKDEIVAELSGTIDGLKAEDDG